MNKVALILTTYNRPQYLKRCLESLAKAVPPDILIIVDDASTDEETKRLLYYFEPDIRWVKHRKKINAGIKDSLLTGFNEAFNVFNCNIAINLDGDSIVKPNFIQKLLSLYDGKHIVSGFNCNNPKNPVISTHDGYVLRKHGNGINMMVDCKQYETILLPALQSDTNWDYASTNKYPFKICSPSVVQHIGLESSMNHQGADIACDFDEKLNLPNITLFGIDSHDPKGIIKAAEISQRGINFGKVKIITEDLFTKGGSTEVRRTDYSRFMIKELHKHVETSHVLTIHADGYVVNPEAWDDNWLQWDFIGALWHWKPKNRNGNGGFSLRSKKFVEATAKLKISDFHPEDEKICDKYRSVLEKEYDIKYAPDEVCLKFSIEAFGAPNNKYMGQFGFHGGNIDFSKLPEKERPYGMPLRRITGKYSALEAWKNRPKVANVRRR